jgi:pyrroloquinoline quinone biosynthesis protein B
MAACGTNSIPSQTATRVELVVLGSGQDGGAPQLGHDDDPAWSDASLRRTAASLGVWDSHGHRWLFEATPDLREQLHAFGSIAPVAKGAPVLDGVFITHAHMGHYVGLMFFGKEVMGTHDLPVHVMPRMAQYLSTNGPWSQLVELNNIRLMPMTEGVAIDAGGCDGGGGGGSGGGDGSVRVVPIRVPHRQEFSEVVGFRIVGPEKSVLFVPDIDQWEGQLACITARTTRSKPPPTKQLQSCLVL